MPEESGQQPLVSVRHTFDPVQERTQQFSDRNVKLHPGPAESKCASNKKEEEANDDDGEAIAKLQAEKAWD